MKRFSAVVVAIVISVGSAAGQRLSDARLRTRAEGCRTTFASSCDGPVAGRLASGDCTVDDGTRYDRSSVTLPASRTVGITLRPLASSFTNPWLAVTGPAGSPPVVYGPAA